MPQRNPTRHDPLTWLASLGLRPRADTLPDLCSASTRARGDVMRCPNKSSGNGRDPPRAHPLGSDVVELILVGLAYFALAYLGLRLASINSSATPIWPPTGFAIAAILLCGNRIAPGISIAASLVSQLTAGSIFTSLAIA